MPVLFPLHLPNEKICAYCVVRYIELEEQAFDVGHAGQLARLAMASFARKFPSGTAMEQKWTIAGLRQAPQFLSSLLAFNAVPYNQTTCQQAPSLCAAADNQGGAFHLLSAGVCLLTLQINQPRAKKIVQRWLLESAICISAYTHMWIDAFARALAFAHALSPKQP